MTQKGTVGTRSHRTSATMKENSGVSWPHWRAAPRAPNQTGPAWSVWGAVITARDQRVTLPGATAMCSPPCAPTQHVLSIRARTDNSPASVCMIPQLPATSRRGSLLLRITDLEPGSLLMLVS